LASASSSGCHSAEIWIAGGKAWVVLAVNDWSAARSNRDYVQLAQQINQQDVQYIAGAPL
jgi:hypothetical protein